MDIRQLRYFIGIANARSYSIAAKSLFVTQPTLTWTIQKLENDLHTKLFDHSDRELVLTESGKLLYEHGKKIVNDIDDLTELIRGYENNVNGSLKIGATVLFSIKFMETISKFISSHSNLEMGLIQNGSKLIQEMVSTGELDLGLVSFPIYFENLEAEPFGAPLPYYEVNAVVSKDSPFASKKSLKLIDLKDEDFSLLSSNFVLGNIIKERCNEIGFDPHVTFQNDNWEVLLENVSVTNSITFLPTDFSNIATRKDVKWIKLNDKIRHIDIGFVKRKGEKLSKPHLLFYQAVKESNRRGT